MFSDEADPITRMGELDLFFMAQGFKAEDDPAMKSMWCKRLDCEMFLKIWGRASSYAGVKAYIMVFFPDPDDPNTDGLFAGKQKIIGLNSKTWKGRLISTLEEMTALAVETINTKCPHCGGHMQKRIVKREGPLKGKEFWGCIDYPRCRGIRAEWKQNCKDDDGKYAGFACPTCGNQMVTRYAKQGPRTGKKFFGCSAYPKCQQVIQEAEAVAIKLMEDSGDNEGDIFRGF